MFLSCLNLLLDIYCSRQESNQTSLMSGEFSNTKYCFKNFKFFFELDAKLSTDLPTKGT